MREILDVFYGSKPVQLLDWYLPDEEDFDLIVWFHGGGMEKGSRKGGRDLAQSAVNHGLGFVSVEYSMYPQARFPEFICDAAEAVAFVLKEMDQYGAKRIIISGQSAGAYLTMMLCLNPAYLTNAGADSDRVIAFVSDSAQQTVHYHVLRERGIDKRAERIDEAAPLYYSGSHKLEKPLLLISYTRDMECRLEQNQLMLQSLRRFNREAVLELVVLPGGHCAGSVKKNENGEFPYFLELLKFIKNL